MKKRGEQDHGAFLKLRPGMSEPKKMRNKYIYCWLAVMILILPLCLSGCSNTAGPDTVEEDAENVSAEYAQKVSVTMTENYSYVLPDGFFEAEEDFDDDLSNAVFYSTKDRNRQIRSWVIEDGFVFPDDVEAMCTENNLDAGYGSLYDTAIAKVKDSIVEDGTTVYRTLYIWPDGPNKVCFIDLASFDKDYSDFETEIRESIHNSNPEEGFGSNGYYGEGIRPPSDEEIDKAMAQEVQEAVKEAERGKEETDWHVFPYF